MADGESEPSDVGGICVVTFRSRETSQNATRELLEILSHFTTVALLTAGLRDDAVIRDRYEVIDIASQGTGFGAISMALRFLRNQVRMCRVIAGREERVILFFGTTAYLVPIAYSRLIGKTVVLEPRGDVPLTLELRWSERMPTIAAKVLAAGVRLLERVSFRVTSAIITYTPAMANQLDLTHYEDKLYTCGARHVDTERFRPERSYSARDPLVGYLGRLDVEKGIPQLASVAERLAPEIGFVFVGDGHYRDDLESRLADEIVEGSVELTGWVDHEEVPTQLNRLRLLVMPSASTEGLPSTILEALACGTPVYATPVGGIPDLVQDGKTGMLMRDTDPGSIAGQVEAAIADPEMAAMSEAGRDLIETEYNFEATVDRYRAMFDRITHASTP